MYNHAVDKFSKGINKMLQKESGGAIGNAPAPAEKVKTGLDTAITDYDDTGKSCLPDPDKFCKNKLIL